MKHIRVLLMQPGFSLLKICRRFFGSLLALLASLGMFSCANVMAPTGGPKDETPPQVVSMIPANNSPNFIGNEVRIFFNEFVQVTNIHQKLLVSPPMQTTPDVRIRGRSIILAWDEALRDSTTYNFFLGDAVSDITENNAIPNFQIVFSTGPFVDSLSLAGTVSNAFSQEPEQGVYVMMYPWGNDSLPLLQRPIYLAKTDKEGRFRIGNTAPGAYLVFALNDLNANFLFDLPNEEIAFLDTLVSPVWFMEEIAPIGEDTLQAPDAPAAVTPQAETPRRGNQAVATIHQPQTPPDLAAALPDPGLPESHRLSLRLFLQSDTIQMVRSGTITRKGFLNIAMRIPFDTLTLRNLGPSLPEPWYISEPSPNRDTLRVWFLPPFPDSLTLEISDTYRILDTLIIATQPRAVRARTELPRAEARLNLSLNAGGGRALPYFEPLVLTSENPIGLFDTTAIALFEADTLQIESQFFIAGKAGRQLQLKTELEPAKSYTLLLLPGTLKDIYGQTHDTLRINFSTTKPEDYGLLILNIRQHENAGRLLVQLASPEGRTVHELPVPENGVVRFKNIRPGSYLIRAIFDANKNGLWDSGHFLKRIQPERVAVNPQQVQIRPNWESEVNWAISPMP